MIHKIASLLRDQISGLDIVEIAGGLVKPTPVRVNVTEEDTPTMLDKTIPMVYNDMGLICEGGTLYPMSPNTEKKSLHFWEDGGTDLVEEQTYYYQNRSTLVLVSWWNMPLINQYLTDPSSLVASLIAAIPERIANTDYITQIRVSFEGEAPSLPDIVSKYSFDEPENQFATYPYSVTALQYSVEWALPKNCVPCVSILPSSCPPQMNKDDIFDLTDVVVGVDSYVRSTIRLNLPTGSNAKVVFNDDDCTICEIVGDGTIETCNSETYHEGTYGIQLTGDYLNTTYLAFSTLGAAAGTRQYVMDIAVLAGFTKLTDLRIQAGATMNEGVYGDIANLAGMTVLEDLFISDTSTTGDFNVISNFPNLKFLQLTSITGMSYTTAVLPKYADGVVIEIDSMNLGTAEVDQVLIDLDTSGSLNGFCLYTAGNDPVSAASAAARASLIVKGWVLV